LAEIFWCVIEAVRRAVSHPDLTAQRLSAARSGPLGIAGYASPGRFLVAAITYCARHVLDPD